MSKVINIDGTKGRYCYIGGTRGVIGLRDYKPTYPSCSMDEEYGFYIAHNNILYYSGWEDPCYNEYGEIVEGSEPGFSFSNNDGIDMQVYVYSEADDYWYSSSTAYFCFWGSLQDVADEVRRIYIFRQDDEYDNPSFIEPSQGDNYEWFKAFYAVKNDSLMAIFENGKYHNKPGYWVLIPDDGLFS